MHGSSQLSHFATSQKRTDKRDYERDFYDLKHVSLPTLLMIMNLISLIGGHDRAT